MIDCTNCITMIHENYPRKGCKAKDGGKNDEGVGVGGGGGDYKSVVVAVLEI